MGHKFQNFSIFSRVSPELPGFQTDPADGARCARTCGEAGDGFGVSGVEGGGVTAPGSRVALLAAAAALHVAAVETPPPPPAPAAAAAPAPIETVISVTWYSQVTCFSDLSLPVTPPSQPALSQSCHF